MTTTTPKKLGRPKSDNPRNVRLYAAVTEEEAAQINEILDGDSMSEWLRSAALAKLASAERRARRKAS